MICFYHISRSLSVLFVAVSLIVSCKSNETMLDSLTDIDLVGSLVAHPGINRLKLTWLIHDENINKAVVYVDTGDSAVARYSGSSEMSVSFDHLEERNYSFSVFLYDVEGHVSHTKITSRIYGDHYIQSLTSRLIRDAIYTDSTVQIFWGISNEDMVGTEIKYINILGDTLSVLIKPDEDSIVLSQYKPGTYFDYRTMYKPVPEAIDTFYAEYKSSKSFSVFVNPILPDRGADPWVIYRDGMYYFTYTQGGGITLYATKKMSQLSAAEPVEVWRPKSGTAYSKNLWAPELHFIDNKWYVYFAADNGQDVNHRMYVIENPSSNPLQGTWEFKGELQESSNNWAIDGTPLEYNGQLYMIWSGKTNGVSPQDLYIASMSNPYTLSGNRIKISTPEYSWERYGSAINEGPEILKNNEGHVFLVYSGSGYWKDEYCLGVLSLRVGGDPLNPADWTKYSEPVFQQAEGAYGTGHCSFFVSRDGTESWILYHARSNPGGSGTRTPRMQRFTWDANGVPCFSTPIKVNEKMLTPSGEF